MEAPQDAAAEARDGLTVGDRFNYGEWVKALYMGLPLEIRKEGEGAEGRGFWSAVLVWLMDKELMPFNGRFVLYDGSHLRALWRWLWSSGGDDFGLDNMAW